LSLSAQQIRKLNRIITLARELIEDNNEARMFGRNGTTRIRRTGKELVQFRRMLRDERKKGVPVAELVRKSALALLTSIY